MTVTLLRRARALVVVVAGASAVACGLVRSLDGFDDDWGKDAVATEGGFDADLDASPDIHVVEVTDAGVSCSAPEVVWTGGRNNLTGPYLAGMTEDDTTLYVVGGAYAGDAAAAGDGGFVLSVGKAPPFDASFLVTGLDQPEAIVTTPNGLFCSAQRTILRIEPDGGTVPVQTVAPANGNGVITDLTGDVTGLYFTTGLIPATARLHFLSAVSGTLESRPFFGAGRVLTDGDWVFVTRRAVDAGPGLIRFEREAAVAEGGTGCAMDPTPVGGVGLDGQRIAWGTIATEIGVSLENACDPPVHATDVGTPMSVAVGPRAIFVRYAGSVALYTFKREKIAGCTYPLTTPTEGLINNKGSQSAFFDGDYVYFQSPTQVYRMHVGP